MEEKNYFDCFTYDVGEYKVTYNGDEWDIYIDDSIYNLYKYYIDPIESESKRKAIEREKKINQILGEND
mgnify:CR=1 FL=1